MLIAVLAESAGKAESGFPPFEAWHMPSQLFWLAVLFTGLYLVLSRHILPKLSDVLERRANRVAADLDEAARLNNDAVEAQKALELRLANARAKARETAEKARAKSEADIAAETARVDAEIARKLEAADARIAALRTKALANVESIAVEAAEAMISRLGVQPARADITKAVAAALKEQT